MASTRTIDTPINTGDQSFDRVLAAGLPVAAYFWTGAKIEPALDTELNAIARAEAGKLLVAKIKTDDNPELVRRFNIATSPTLTAFKDKGEFSRAERPSPGEMRAQIDYVLGRSPKPTPPTPAHTTTVPGGGKPVTVTDQSFSSEVLQAQVPVVVDFWAPWCGPCRMVAPALEKIAADYAGRVRVAKLNVDENQRTSMHYQVQSIPTLLLVKNGRVVDRLVGAYPEAQIRTRVEQLLKG